MLEHLIIVPQLEPATRFRVIASGLRVCDYYQSTLTIVWEEGNLDRLIKLPKNVRVVSEMPDENCPRYHPGDNVSDIPFQNSRTACVCTCHNFSGDGMEPFRSFQLAPWLPQFSDEVKKRAKAIAALLKIPPQYVGMHVRRGDNKTCISDSPDALFFEAAQNEIKKNAGVTIVLACEEENFRKNFIEKFPQNTILLPTCPKMWHAGSINTELALLDTADMQILSDASHVLGTDRSSFSEIVIALCGSMESRLIGEKQLCNFPNPRLSLCSAAFNWLPQIKKIFHANIEVLRNHPDIEWVLFDYASQDGLEEWIRNQGGVPTNFRYVREENEAAAWHAAKIKNKALRLGRGRWIMSLDADNLINETIVNLPFVTEGVLHNWSGTHGDGTYGRILASREMFYYLGGFDETFPPESGEDEDFVLRAQRGFPRHFHRLLCARQGIAVKHHRRNRKMEMGIARRIFNGHARKEVIRIQTSSIAAATRKKDNAHMLVQSSFLSFKNTLSSEIENLNKLPRPVCVLVWGTGFSFPFLCETLKDESNVFIIEHDITRRFLFSGKLKNRITQKCLHTQRPFGGSENYTTYPLLKFKEDGVKYDLIIIDGRNRADCLGVASLLLADGGHVILHDAQRGFYQTSFPLYKSIRILKNADAPARTAVLSNPLFNLPFPSDGKKESEGRA
jgi:hypothetical protein